MVRLCCAWMLALALLGTLAVPAGARDLLGLTADERIIRFAPETPGTITFDRPVESHDNMSGLGLTWAADDLWVLASGTRVMLDLGQPGALAMRWYPIPPDSLAGARGFTSGINGIVATTGSHLLTLDRNWPNGGVESSESLPAGLDLVANAIANNWHFAIDAAADTLVRKPLGGDFTTVGPLGVAVDAPAGLEIVGNTGYLAAAGKLHRVDLDTGAATEVGTIGAGAGETVLDLAAQPPPYVLVDTRNVRPYVGEPEGRAVVTIARRGDPDLPLSVPWSAVRADGHLDAAEPGLDFVPTSGVLTLAPGQHRTTIEFPLVDDDEAEYVEVIGLRFDQAHGAVDQQIQLWDAGDPEFASTAMAVTEASGTANVQVRRPPGLAGPISADVAVGGTAKPGADFGPVPARITFEGDETSKTIRIPIRADGEREGTERIELRLSSPGETRLVNPLRRATVTIADAGAGTAAARDRLAPAVRLLGSSRTRLRRTLKVRLRCSEACTVTGDLRLASTRAKKLRVPKVLARGRASVKRAGTATVSLRLGARMLKRLRARAPQKVALRLVARDAAGNARTVRRTLTLRR